MMNLTMGSTESEDLFEDEPVRRGKRFFFLTAGSALLILFITLILTFALLKILVVSL